MADRGQLDALIAENRQGVLATINADGRPQLSNILYLWDPEQQLARITTTATRLKARNLQRDPRCSLHVGGDSFWAYAVAAGEAEVTAATTGAGDEVALELLPLYTALMGAREDEQAFFAKMVEEERLIIRFRYSRIHGVVVDKQE
jgi:PPOX class probable F420-dependent enzyme